MPPAIRVENLGKSYRVGRSASTRGYRTLRESLVDATQAPLRRLRRGAAEPRDEEFWALKGVDFEVQPGEVVGIIGRNGAGKSTLLKILSRITKPTTGRVELRGRVGSLLEVGTGFHPELTGRENIFLNGSILGMKRTEIARKFDEIVAFAEVEKFLDTPVKRYSSGMYVRLAFAVAAFLEPEILIVDEVLAVGDATFQKKCLGKMHDVSNSGRTVFFVSHQMESVRRLCTSVTWLHNGRVVSHGDKNTIIAKYLSKDSTDAQAGAWVDLTTTNRSGNGEAIYQAFRISSGCDVTANQPYSDGPLDITMTIDSSAYRTISSLAVTFYDRFGTKLVNADTLELGRSIPLKEGLNEIIVHLDQLHLKPGIYSLGLWLSHGGEVLDHIENAALIEVVVPPMNGFGGRPPDDGFVTCDFQVI